MKKQTIGKVQLGIGILIICLGIFGLVFANNMYSKVQNSAEITDINYLISANGFILNIALASGLGILLSLLFITQGLITKSTISK